MNNLLLRGESGVGKEIVARYAWSLEGDTNRPFVTVHASAVNSQTFESELFGHKKGSFTGAAADKEGMFALAHTGDLFLDEIGTWEEAIQIKLLRFLEYREITPVGGATRKIRTRAIAATNTDLEEAVRMGTFRHDLYERIRALTIFIPPLRDRKEDIPDLVEIFSEEFARQTGHKVKLSNEAMSFAVDYHWTGNVRQLKGVMECLAYDFDTKDVSLGQFKDNIANYGTAALATSPQDKKEPILERETVKLGSHKLLMLKYEQDVIRAALAASEDIPSAAKLLQISRSGIYKKLQQWGWWDALTMSKNKQEQQ